MTIVIDKTIPKPDFLVIGTQKGGTTWLRRTLLQHPEVYIPPYPEEVHFFNRSLLQPDLYFALFNLEESKGKLLGEKSPNYFHMPEKCIHFIKEIVPEVKLVAILRNPVERAWSQARMQTSDFNKKDLTKKDLFKLILQVASRGNFERTNYANILQKWSKHFPKDQLKIYYYDDLQSDPQTFLNAICEDLEISNFQSPDLQKRVHVSKPKDMPKALHWFLTWRYRNLASRLKRQSYEVPKSWSAAAPNIPFYQKAVILLLFLPYHLASSILYQVYKFRFARSIVVPKIVWE